MLLTVLELEKAAGKLRPKSVRNFVQRRRNVSKSGRLWLRRVGVESRVGVDVQAVEFKSTRRPK